MPRDSKSHAVERGMSSLKEAVGDGRFVTPSVRTVTEAYSKELFNMRSDEVKQAEKLQQEAAIGCARDLASWYEGTSCTRTSIHGYVDDPSDTF